MIVTMRPWHLMSVTLNMRSSDREEFSLMSDTDPERWACRRALEPGLHFAAVTSAGMPVACFGFIEAEDAAAASIWMVATDRWKPYLKSMLRAYDAVLKSGKFRVLQTGIRKGRKESVKFIEWLGFEYRGDLPGYLSNGDTMLMFSKVV